MINIFDKLQDGEYFVKIGDSWTYAYYSRKYNDWYNSEDDWYYNNEEILDIELPRGISGST